jgi:Domain of unknown function (DUF5925)/ATPase family associated with various cellular activities (AAA)
VRIPRQLEILAGAAGTGPESLLPVVVTIDDCDTTRDVIDVLGLAAFVAGDQPYAVHKSLDHVRDDATLLPAGASVLRETVWGGERAHLAVGDGWTLRAVHWRSSKTATVAVTAITAELGGRIMALATDGMTEPPPPADDVVMGFWHSANGYRRHPRSITAARWADIRGNYARSAATQFDRLAGVDRDSLRGRLLLLYGPPGTGKTTVLRALARQWRDWCQFDCVLDPEALFRDPAYLMEIVLHTEDDDADQPEKWRLLLLEDCDELIRAEAKASSGQAMSRLLNLTDGLLGQGRKVLVALTTNEHLARLHPAIVRPGRCLASVEVPALPYPEAAAWLGSATRVPTGGATLAELYALRDGAEEAIERPPVRYGQYL